MNDDAAQQESSAPLDVVVFGIINAGKSSLINALTRRADRPAAPIGGTTAEVAGVDWAWAEALAPEGFAGPVRLVDTPGIEEAGQHGAGRGELALAAARAADLILFVLAEDLTAAARDALVALREAGKPMVVAVNKVDLLDDEERAEVVGAIRRGLDGVVPADDVIEVAAAPIVRRPVRDDSGRLLRVEAVRGEPDVAALEARLREILAESAGDLRDLATAADAVDRHVARRDADRASLRRRAEWTADETSAGLAVALAINPVPLLDFLAGPSGLAILVRRVAAVYDEPMTADVARGLALDLIRGGRVALWGALAGTIAGGALKVIPGIGHLAGALGQGASAGYFGHVVGRALVTYLENGRDWGDGGVVAELNRVAAATDRRAVTRGLVDRIRSRLRSDDADESGGRPG